MAARCTLFYLHGFNSSPNSVKARQLRAYLDQHSLQIEYCVPNLPFDPVAAMHVIERAINADASTRIGIVGSSLGGFYATYIAEKYNLKAVLINPAVRPYILLENYLGEQQNPHTGERYLLSRTHIEQLKALDYAKIQHQQNILLLAQTADETLNYRDAVEKYAGCQQIVESGGSHAFDNFERHIPTILKFFDFIPKAFEF